MPQSSVMSLTVILCSGFSSSSFFNDASSARLVTCDMEYLLCQLISYYKALAVFLQAGSFDLQFVLA